MLPVIGLVVVVLERLCSCCRFSVVAVDPVDVSAFVAVLDVLVVLVVFSLLLFFCIDKHRQRHMGH